MQICALLTRIQCKVSDTQVTGKASGPLVFIEDGPRKTTILINNRAIINLTIPEIKTMTVPIYCSSNCNSLCTCIYVYQSFFIL